MRTLAGAVLGALLLVAGATAKPNIVLVMADDQGWGDMAYNGHPRLQTPYFDEASAAGLRFDRFYAAAPVCSPTRASIMTGRTPNRSKVFKWGYPLRPQETTVAEVLKTAGYMTAHFGKWHLGSVRSKSPSHPGVHGFDYWFSAPNFYDNDAVLSAQGRAVATQGESSFVTVDAAIEWMRGHAAADRPFFAVVWFGSPHAPHRASKKYFDMYADVEDERKRNFYGEVTGMDAAFGKLREAIADMGVREETVLWYTSDNGALPHVGSAGPHRGLKSDVYDGGLLVPSFVEWPAKITAPRKTSIRAATYDLYPTVLEIAGARANHQPRLDGVSLLPLIERRMDRREKPMGFWDTIAKGISTPSLQWMGELLEAQQAGGDLEPHESSMHAAELPDPPHSRDSFPGHAAWIDGDWKLHRIEDEAGAVSWELYDLASDPREEHDVIGEQAALAAQLRRPFVEWLESVVDSLNGEDYVRAGN